MSRRSYFGLYCALMLTTSVASAGITVIYNDLPTLQRVFPGQPALAWTRRTSEATGFTYILFTAFFAVGAQVIFALLRASRIVEPLHGSADFPSQAAFSLSFAYIALTGLMGIGVALRLPNRQPLKFMEAAAL
jgi:hypothetical protein